MDLSPHTYTPFGPDLVDPSQLAFTPVQPWPRVMAFAVLEEALSCLSGQCVGGMTQRAKARLQREAQEWVASDTRGRWALTFLDVCEALGLEPAWLRSAVLRPGFRLPRGLRMNIVVGGQVRQTSADLLTRIGLVERTKARRTV